MLPIRNVTDKITAHYGAKDRVLWNVVEEIRRAFQELAAALDKPTFVPGRQGDQGAPGAGGIPSRHVIDGLTPLSLNAAFSADPDGSIFTVRNDLQEPRLKAWPPQAQTLGFTGTEIWLDDSRTYFEAGTDEVYRGISVRGNVTVNYAAEGGGLQEQFENGSFDGATFASREGTGQPHHWPCKGNYAIVPGDGPNGETVLALEVGGGASVNPGATTYRLEDATFLIGGSPSGGTFSCVGDIGGPGLSNGTSIDILVLKTTTLVLTFSMRLSGGVSRDIGMQIYAQDSADHSAECPTATPRYALVGASGVGVQTISASSWTLDGTSTVVFNEVPGDNVWRNYTVNIDTNGVGGSVPDPFYFDFNIFENQDGGGSGTLEITAFSMPIQVDVPDPIVTPLTIYGQTFDQLEVVVSVPQTLGEFTFSGFTALNVTPTFRPITGPSSVLTVTEVRGATFGLRLDDAGDDGTTSVPTAVSAYFEEPAFGTGPFAAMFGGNVAIRDQKQLRFYETGNGNYTSLRATTQSGNIDYVLPDSQGNTGDVLTNDGSGGLSWEPSGSSGGGRTLIDEVILSTDDTIVFTGIPDTYEDLLLVIDSRNTVNSAPGMLMYFNGDTTNTNYFGQIALVLDAGTFFDENDKPFVGHGLPSGGPSGWAHSEILIPKYGGATDQKLASARTTSRQSATTIYDGQYAMHWENDDPITDIEVVNDNATNTFGAGTRARLYGLN